MSISLIKLTKHFNLLSEKDIQKMLSANLSSSGIRYFEYLRIYDGGTSIIFASNHKLMQYIFKNEVTVVAPVEQRYVKNKFHYCILPTDSYEKVIHDVKSYFDLSYFINFVERHQGYLDIYCFGTHANNPKVYNFYLNHIEQLENFKSVFKEKTHYVLKEASLTKIVLPKKMLPLFKGLSQSEHAVKNPYSLSKRQIECLELLVKGMTMKQISNTLHLSPKTIEHYLEAVKLKMNCYSRVELFEKAALMKMSLI